MESRSSPRNRSLFASSVVPALVLLMLLAPAWALAGSSVSAAERVRILAAAVVWGWLPGCLASFGLAGPSLRWLSRRWSPGLVSVLAVWVLVGACVLHLSLLAHSWLGTGSSEAYTQLWGGMFANVGVMMTGAGAAVGLLCGVVFWILGGRPGPESS